MALTQRDSPHCQQCRAPSHWLALWLTSINFHTQVKWTQTQIHTQRSAHCSTCTDRKSWPLTELKWIHVASATCVYSLPPAPLPPQKKEKKHICLNLPLKNFLAEQHTHTHKTEVAVLKEVWRSARELAFRLWQVWICNVQTVIIVGALGLSPVNCQVQCFDACLVFHSA